SNLPAIGLTRYTVTIARAEAFILPRPLVCYWQRAMAKKTHPHKMVIFLRKIRDERVFLRFAIVAKKKSVIL
ncbi:MAG: hypothetical protein UDD86_10765, partial [Sodaliphilus sp.]|nr:hypothetical protein [Sodaliphilus sp.]